MKKAIISGFFAIISSLWAIAISTYIMLNLTDHWYNSRFWGTAVQNRLVIPLVISLAACTISLVMLAVEYFRKEK